MNVIVLKGPANCGKSHTLGIAYQLLLSMGYTQIPGHFGQVEAFNFLGEKVYGNKDFTDILEKDGKRVGIATGEDTKKELSTILNYFKNSRCETAICSCLDDPEYTSVIEEYPVHTFITKVSETTDSLKRIHDWEFAKKMMAHLYPKSN